MCIRDRLYGAPPPAVVAGGERFNWRLALLLPSVLLLLVLGLTMPAPLAVLLERSVAIVVHY